MADGLNEADKGGEGQSGEAKPEVKAKPAETPKSEVKVKPPEAEKKSPEPKQVEADDEIPEDSELISMSKSALGKRLDRHTKKELRERFGTDDYAKIKADLDEVVALRAEKEQKKRAEMTENERLKDDLAKEKKRADEAEAKAQKTVDAQTFAEYDATAKEAFGDRIAPKHFKRAMRELKEHVIGLGDDAPADTKKAKKVFDSWTNDWLKENPEFAKPAAEEPKKINLSTGSNPNAKRDRGDANLTEKTPKPGQANSMTRAEYAQYKRERGLS